MMKGEIEGKEGGGREDWDWFLGATGYVGWVYDRFKVVDNLCNFVSSFAGVEDGENVGYCRAGEVGSDLRKVGGGEWRGGCGCMKG